MASPAPISLCMIVKNEEINLERCLESVRPYVSEICIIDTGSDDRTPEIAKKFSDKFELYTDCNNSDGLISSFSEAREKSFSLATYPWVMWIDGDDVLHQGDRLPELIDKYDEKRAGSPACVFYPYEYAHDHHGNVTCFHYRERLVTPKSSFKWIGPVHEILSPQDPTTVMIQSDDLKFVHRKFSSNKPTESMRNLRILKETYEIQRESDVRLLYYLGLEYANAGDVANSLRFHKRYVELSGWDEEKYQSCLAIAQLYQGLGQHDDALDWAFKCLRIKEGWAEAYFTIGKIFYSLAQNGGPQEKRNWEKAVYFIRQGLMAPPTETLLFVNPLERSYDIHRYLNLALSNIGETHAALSSCEQALEVCPDDQSLIHNKKTYERHLTKVNLENNLNKLIELGDIDASKKILINKIVEGEELDYVSNTNDNDHLEQIKSLWEFLLKHDEVINALNLLKSVPWTIRNHPDVRRMISLTEPMIAHLQSDNDYSEFYSNYGASGEIREAIPIQNPVLEEYSQWPRWKFTLDVVDELSNGGKKKLRILDIGSFDGWITNRLGQMGHETYGVEASQKFVDLANNIAKEHATGATHAQAVVPYDVLPEYFPTEFDLILCYELYEHVPDTQELIDFIYMNVSHEGTVLITCPRGSWMQGQRSPIQEGWNEPVCREHVRAPINEDVEEDLKKFGFHIISSTDSRDSWSSDIPGQAIIMVRASRVKPEETSDSIINTYGPKLDIVMYVGPGLESWSPPTVKENGIGGSELMAMEISKRLAREGHRVTLYGDCKDMQGIYDGVEYVHHEKFQSANCDIFITSRKPAIVDRDIKAKAVFCWVHDVHCGPALTHSRALRIDKFLCLSNWHKDYFLSQYKFIHPDQVIVTRNGIDNTRFLKFVDRNPHKAVYSSSPDRGLPVALDCWPKVRQQVPDAELHIYYGFDNWRKSARISNDQGQLDLIESINAKIIELRDQGVVYHGRINQEKLTSEFLSAGVWAYPTWFHETSCITAMEAQAAGLFIVTSSIAALNETVGEAGTLISGDWLSYEYQDKWVSEVVRYMNTPELEAERKKIQSGSSKFSLNLLTQIWINMFFSVMEEVRVNVLPPYKSILA